ncbi:MAG TPA: zf-HC2 domain-containing protein [Acidimicrobiales bacterium]|nr:zf-HC2 domain-containing protein [Acidimicrobiales bacterium]
MTAPGSHADDLLSAHLDGELDPATDAWVVEHLAACPACRAAAEELAEARSLLRNLPPVDASPVIEGFLERHRALIRSGAAFVGVAALVLAAIGLTAATVRPEVVPDLDGMADAHVAGAHDRLGDVRPVTGDAGDYDAPPGLIGSDARLSRHAVFEGTDLTAVVYRDGDVALSVYEQPGRLDRDALPPGEVMAVGGHLAWFRPGSPVVAVAELGDLVITVVSEDRAAVVTALSGMPEWRRHGTWDRIHDASQRLTEVFALGG